MALYKGVEIAAELTTSIRYMEQVEEYREALQVLQAAWDNLALLGQLSGTRIEIGEVRSAFAGLTSSLLNNLGRELRRKAAFDLQAKAQVAIDILVRNLFERTADIGFLATDSDLRSFAEATAEQRQHLRPALLERFREYQRKYSVYSDILLLSPTGEVLAQLDERAPVASSRDPLIAESLSTSAAYVETYRHSDLQPAQENALIYSYRVMSADGQRAVAVLSLCFRFADECRRIFDGLIGSSDWCVITLLDDNGRVIASSDIHQTPLNSRIAMSPAATSETEVVRYGGRPYLSAIRHTAGYQGYMGPGWFGHAMLPLEFAFSSDEQPLLEEQVGPTEFAQIMASETLFSESLRDIPRVAGKIQAELNRAVWNGNVALVRESKTNSAFSKTLLREIGNTGIRTRDVFSRAIANMNQTVVSSILRDCRAKAALSIDIMDRNLYERANDCRWWALTTAFRQTLTAVETDSTAQSAITQILETINGLYTVYTNLVLFDANGRIVATSNRAYRERVGQKLERNWVRETLALGNSESYCVSAFEPSDLYEHRHTYIYCAAIRGPNESPAVVGGIAIVFDAEPQFRAMLSESLPRDEKGEIKAGSFGVFVDRELRVIASSRAGIAPGSRMEIDCGEIFSSMSTAASSWEKVVAFDGSLYAVGACGSSGYREYKNNNDPYRNDVTSLVFVPLADCASSGRITATATRAERASVSYGAQEQTIDLASFAVCGKWYAVPASEVVEAVHADKIATMPGAPDYVRGCVIIRDTAIAVLDIAHMLGQKETTQAAELQQIVIIQATPQRASFGLLVDDLGENPEIPLARIVQTPDVFHSRNALVENLVKPDPAVPGDTILMLLSIDRLAARAPGARLDPAAAVA